MSIATLIATLPRSTAAPAISSRLLLLTRHLAVPTKMPLIASTGKDRVILGLMTFGPTGTESKGARISNLDDFNKCLDYFQREGYSEVDTARAYISGEQEAFTKEANWKSRGLKIATKCYPNPPGLHKPDQLKATFNKSLSELGTDCVDIFYLHAPDRTVPFEETLEACNDLFKEGKFVQLGLSNYAAWEVAEIVNIARERGWVRPSIYQGKAGCMFSVAHAVADSRKAMYNAVTRSMESELIPCCRKYGIDLVVYNPLAGGLFSGKYNTKDAPSEGRFAAGSRVGDMYRERYFKDTTFEALKMIEPVVKRHNLTLLETALRWTRHHSLLKMNDGGGDGVIIGVSSLSQLESNLRDLEKGPLPEEVVAILDKGWELTRSTCPSYWR